MKNNRKTTLLTIEDDLVVRKSLATYLEGLGYTVQQAENGLEGIELFNKDKPDLVLTDLRLPKLDGLKVIERIRSSSPETPVVVLSGMGTLNDAIKALRLGAVDYITKPVTDLVLIKHTVERALERVRLLKENKKHQEYLEQEVERKTAELHQAQKFEAIGTLAGGIAHDFNNILAVIIGHADLALMGRDPHSELAGDLQEILKASDRAKNLVLQILNFGRRNEIRRMPLQLVVIIKETVKMLRSTFPATALLHLETGGSSNSVILADPVEVHQILTNLCTNALHALPAQQGNIYIRIESILSADEQLCGCEEPLTGNYLRLTIRDDGCGIAKEHLDSIFEPFFTTKEKGEGTGLGLSVVNEIVKNCDGLITVESKVGEGTVFSLLFPLLAPVKEQGNVFDNGSLPHGTEKILFIDDEEGLINTVERMLKYLGYEPICCSSGANALAILEKNEESFDLIITDQSMPKIPGNVLIEKIHASYPDLPILLCTGYSSIVDEDSAVTLGAKGFLMKPISIGELAKAVRKVLDETM